MQLSLVSHYGQKSQEFGGLIHLIQEKVSSALGEAFVPYKLEQVHGTLIGLECEDHEGELLNLNFRNLRNERRKIDWDGLLAYLQSPDFPNIRFCMGGYEASEEYSFLSQGEHPYVRSVQVNDRVVVVMGWPTDAQDACALDVLRRSFQKYGVIHKWHKGEQDVDNDLYFVLGKVEVVGDNSADLEWLQSVLRELVARQSVEINVCANSLSFVSYTSQDLPLHTSNRIGIFDMALDEAGFPPCY